MILQRLVGHAHNCAAPEIQVVEGKSKNADSLRNLTQAESPGPQTKERFGAPSASKHLTKRLAVCQANTRGRHNHAVGLAQKFR